jgi:hypothetical protein
MCLTLDEHKRPSAIELLKHEFLANKTFINFPNRNIQIQQNENNLIKEIQG